MFRPVLVMRRAIPAAILTIVTVTLLASRARPQSNAFEQQKVNIAPDLAQRVVKFKPVKMPFDSRDLTARERKMVEKLVDASGLLDCIYWRQSDPEGLKLYLSLAKSTDPQDKLLREYLKINGGRFDQIDDNKPFVGTRTVMPPGVGFFPEDMTRQA